MRKINLHNHTTFSDGKKSPKELIEEAIEKGLDEIAISDHYEYFLGFLKYKSNIYLYFNVLNHMKKKYKNKIKIFSGLEIDFKTITEPDLPYEFFKDIDFILFERINNIQDLKELIELKKEIPVKIGLAHPSFKGFNDYDELIQLLEQNNIFIELNTSCYYYFSPQDKPNLPEHPLIFEKQEDFFKKLNNRNIEISIGVDVHRIEDDVNDVDKAYKFLDKMKLKSKLIKL